MPIIFITILILFLIKLLHDSLGLMRLWQVKMYRADRMMSHLKEDKNIFQNNLFYISAIIIFVFLYTNQIVQELSFRAAGEKSDDIVKFLDFSLRFASFEMTKIEFILYIALAFFLIAFLQIINEIKKRIFLRPKPTLKVILIFLLLATVYSMIIFCWISSFSITEEARIPVGSLASGIELMLFVYLVNPLVISSIVLATNPFFDFQKRKIIKKAALKMRELKKVRVIGITGSYGKTSTKEFLYAILSQKYKVVKTEGNNNTNIGVAYTVLNKVSDDYDYFICEMGAYKIGEIAEICSIVKPEIGILTGINEQHLDLFGSIENTTKAKFELIEALPEDGLAILNGDNKYIKKEVENRSESFSPTINFFRAKALAPCIKVYQDYVEFIYKNYRFKLNLLGKHYIENILSAIIVVEYLGMNLDEIKNAVEKIKPTKFMMKKLNGPNDSIFIDDSYSANPDGVLAALDYLEETYQDYKKIIVFPGIIELGKTDDEVHQKLFSRIGEVCDMAYIVSQKSIKLKVYKVNENSCKFVFEKGFDKVIGMLKNNLDKNTVVLFENRGAGVVMKKML